MEHAVARPRGGSGVQGTLHMGSSCTHPHGSSFLRPFSVSDGPQSPFLPRRSEGRLWLSPHSVPSMVLGLSVLDCSSQMNKRVGGVGE